MSRWLRLYEAVIVRALIVTGFVMIGAGGLGMAAVTGLIGLLLLPIIATPALRAGLSQPVPLLVLATAIVWAGLSLSWSPHDRPDQALKLALLTPLFILAPFALARFSEERRASLFRWLSACTVLLAIYFLFEIASGSLLTRTLKIYVDGAASPRDAQILADRVLGRGMSAYLMVMGPAAIGLWVCGGAVKRAAAIVLFVVGAIGSTSFGVAANCLALCAAILAAGLAWRFPRSTLQIGLVTGGGLIIAAPLLMGAFISLLPEAAVDALPVSWAMRIEIWRFAMEQIALAPVLGHGLDASRVISDLAVLRGEEFDRLPLHAHNAGLTIWLETGAIGALLFGAAPVALSQAVGAVRIGRMQAAAIAFAAVTFLVTVLVGSGVWQEWLHGSLGFAIAAALLIRR